MHYERKHGFYQYQPSISAALLFMVLFLTLLLIESLLFLKFYFKTSRVTIDLDDLKTTEIPPANHCGPPSRIEGYTKSKAKMYCMMPSVPIITGIILEFLGYVARIISINDNGLAIFIISQMSILLAPNFIAGGIYMTFGRIVEYFQAHDQTLLKSKHLTTFLVMVDVFATMTISVAASLMADLETEDLGFKICLLGLSIQLMLFALFVYMALRFLSLLNSNPNKYVTLVETYYEISWKKTLWVLIGAMSWIILRCILRLAEFAQRYDGVLARRELSYYLIDALPIFIAAVIISVYESEKVLWKLNCVYVETRTFGR